MLTTIVTQLAPYHLAIGFVLEALLLILVAHRWRIGMFAVFGALAIWALAAVTVIRADGVPEPFAQAAAIIIFGPTLLATAIGALLWIFFPKYTLRNPRPLNGGATFLLIIGYPLVLAMIATGQPHWAHPWVFYASLFVFALPWLLIGLGYTTAWLVLAIYYAMWAVADVLTNGFQWTTLLRAALVIAVALYGLLKWKHAEDQHVPYRG